MQPEAIELERMRQKIEAAEMEAGNMSDYMDYGKPNEKEKKAAQERIAQANAETAALKAQLHDLLGKTPRAAVEEWVNWHKGMLQAVVDNPGNDANAKTRLYVAKTTLEEWEKVLRGEQEFVRINWHFLKAYREEAISTFKKKWWKVGG